jgi:catechol 2,3-dioxygenase-like lactoylglutathione lyase family enzyme
MGTPPVETVRFDHVALSTTDLEATIDFYSKAFGFRVLGQLLRDDDPRVFNITYLQAGPAILEVFTFAAPMLGCPWREDATVTGLRHLGIRARDVRAATLGARAAGAKIVAEAVEEAVQPWSLVTDPDGIPVQVVARD